MDGMRTGVASLMCVALATWPGCAFASSDDERQADDVLAVAAHYACGAARRLQQPGPAYAVRRLFW